MDCYCVWLAANPVGEFRINCLDCIMMFNYSLSLFAEETTITFYLVMILRLQKVA